MGSYLEWQCRPVRDRFDQLHKRDKRQLLPEQRPELIRASLLCGLLLLAGHRKRSDRYQGHIHGFERRVGCEENGPLYSGVQMLIGSMPHSDGDWAGNDGLSGQRLIERLLILQ